MFPLPFQRLSALALEFSHLYVHIDNDKNVYKDSETNDSKDYEYNSLPQLHVSVVFNKEDQTVSCKERGKLVKLILNVAHRVLEGLHILSE